MRIPFTVPNNLASQVKSFELLNHVRDVVSCSDSSSCGSPVLSGSISDAVTAINSAVLSLPWPRVLLP